MECRQWSNQLADQNGNISQLVYLMFVNLV